MDIKTAIYRFCNYQERSQQEVKDRLYELGSYPEEVATLISDLIEAQLLNEERFVKAFARGKFGLKHWGRVKITHALKGHRISPYLLKKALEEIDKSAYFATALKLIGRKWEALKTEKNTLTRKAKVFRYMLGKGYETNIIIEALKEVMDT